MEELLNNEGLKFLNFENEMNNCWLDSSLALIAHIKTFKTIVECFPKSKINEIITMYNEAINIFNNPDCTVEERISRCKDMLFVIQTSTLDHLEQFMKSIPGEPDSAFCALLNLINQDASDIKERLTVAWAWRKKCSNCGVISSTNFKKFIITLSKVDVFDPECPSSFYTCACKSSQQMKLIYKELPPCLIFHFEKGAGIDTNFPESFSIKNREYQLTGIVVFEKSSDPNLNHFVTWIRNPFSSKWLECNDLIKGIVTFSSNKPNFNLQDIYIYVFEAFDNLDKIRNEISVEQEQEAENSNVELIDLSDEDDTDNTGSCRKSKASKLSNSIKNNDNSLLNAELDASKKEQLVNDTDKLSSVSKQNFKMCNNEKSGKNERSKNHNVLASNAKFPIKISLNSPEKEEKFKTIDCQNKSVDKFIDSEEDNYPEHKVAKTAIENKEKISSVLVNNEASNISCHNVSVSSFRSPNEIYFSGHETATKSNNFECYDDAIEASLEEKESKVDSEHEVADNSDLNKEAILNTNKTSIQNLKRCSSEKLIKNVESYSLKNQKFFNDNPSTISPDNCEIEASKSVKKLKPETDSLTSKIGNTSDGNTKENFCSSFTFNRATENGTADKQSCENISTHTGMASDIEKESKKYKEKKLQIKQKLSEELLVNSDKDRPRYISKRKLERIGDNSVNSRLEKIIDNDTTDEPSPKKIFVQNCSNSNTAVSVHNTIERENKVEKYEEKNQQIKKKLSKRREKESTDNKAVNSTVEKIIENDTTDEASLKEKSVRNCSMSSSANFDNPLKRENKAKKYGEKNQQIKMKLLSNSDNSNENKKNLRYVNKRRQSERICDKYVGSSDERRANIDDQGVNASLSDDQGTKSTFKRSKSNDSDHDGKSAKLSEGKNNNVADEQNQDPILIDISLIVDKTFGAIAQKVFRVHEHKLSSKKYDLAIYKK